MLKYKKLDDMDLFILAANMGSCQCGDIETFVAVDHSLKTVTSSKSKGYPWKSGRLVKGTLVISYVPETVIVPEGYRHIIRKLTKLERALFDEM